MSDPIWAATLDEQYACEVNRIDERHGRLTVRNIENDFLILDKEVHLGYGAQFGPDISDILDWQDMVVTAVEEAQS